MRIWFKCPYIRRKQLRNLFSTCFFSISPFLSNSAPLILILFPVVFRWARFYQPQKARLCVVIVILLYFMFLFHIFIRLRYLPFLCLSRRPNFCSFALIFLPLLLFIFSGSLFPPTWNSIPCLSVQFSHVHAPFKYHNVPRRF